MENFVPIEKWPPPVIIINEYAEALRLVFLKRF